MCDSVHLKLDLTMDALSSLVNPIPTGQGRNQPLYERHVTNSGSNRVKPSGQAAIPNGC